MMDNINIVIPMMGDPAKKKPTYAEVQQIQVTLDAGLDAVIGIQIDDEDKKSESAIIIPDFIKEKMKVDQNILTKIAIVAVGPNKDQRPLHITVGDIWYVYPGAGTKIMENGVEYLIYNEREMQAKVKQK